MKKNKIAETIVNWDSYELDGFLPDAIKKLQSLVDDNPNHFDFKIDVQSKSGWYGECSTNIVVSAYRWETDAECVARLEASKNASERAKLAAKARAEQNAKRERSLYESLKRKFEKEINEGQK